MFEFRPNESFKVRAFDDKPKDTPRNMLYLVKLRDSPCPEGILLSKTIENPSTAPLPYGVVMMRELDDGWAWDWPDHSAREDIGSFLVSLMEEYSEEAILEQWLWLEIFIDQEQEPSAKDKTGE